MQDSGYHSFLTFFNFSCLPSFLPVSFPQEYTPTMERTGGFNFHQRWSKSYLLVQRFSVENWPFIVDLHWFTYYKWWFPWCKRLPEGIYLKWIISFSSVAVGDDPPSIQKGSASGAEAGFDLSWWLCDGYGWPTRCLSAALPAIFGVRTGPLL